MKVFISWSGERSRQVAELFKVWLKWVIQACDPWVSTQDIDSGSLWFNEINNQLSEISVGIICLTKENKDRPWILFEAGALTKGLSTSRVIPFLIDLNSLELRPPLSQLNAVTPDRDGLLRLTKTINFQLKDAALTQEVFNPVFENYWPQFEERLNLILSSTSETEQVDGREEKDILSEILLTVRGFDKRLRKLEVPISNVIWHANYQFPEKKSLMQTDLKEFLDEYIINYYQMYVKFPTSKDIISSIPYPLVIDYTSEEIAKEVTLTLNYLKQNVDKLRV